MGESETIIFINEKYKTKLKLVKDKFNDYDAEDDNYICEIKNRRKYYNIKVIEAIKLFKNFRNANRLNKIFIYVVTDEKGVWIYNITSNIDKIISTKPIAMLMPVSTDFENKNKIIKYCFKI